MSGETVLESSGGGVAPKLAGAAALLGVAGVLGWLAVDFGFLAGMGAFIFGVAGLSVAAFAFAWSGKGPCPACGKVLDDLPPDLPGLRCVHCAKWLRISDKRMSVTPDDFVAESPTYPLRVEVGQQPALAELCVCCGVPATQRASYEMRKTVLGAPGVGRVIKVWPIELPVCAAHPVVAPGIDAMSFEGELRIKSFAAYRAGR